MSADLEITGTWLANTGAAQMLEAAVQRVRGLDGEHDIAVEPRWGGRGLRHELRLRDVVANDAAGGAVFERGRGLLRAARARRADQTMAGHGIVRRSEVGALLDCSGFALSDQWGATKANDRWRTAQPYHERGRAIVLAPQAMGPFDDAETAAAARSLLEAADLVWVRDDRSYEHAVSLAGPLASIRRAPDITLGLSAEPPNEPPADVVLVPNERMVDRGGWSRATYIHTLAAAGAVARATGHSVEVLIHTNEPGDSALGASIADALQCPVIRERRGTRVKGRLGAARVVVASRFHALLGALGQGVPAIGVGWSHKYGELYRELDCKELIVDDEEAVTTLTREILRDGDDVRGRMSARLPALLHSVEEMWEETFPLLGLSQPLLAAPAHP